MQAAGLRLLVLAVAACVLTGVAAQEPPSLLSLSSLSPRLALAEARARAALQQVARDARAALSASVATLRATASGDAAPAAAAARAANDAAAGLGALVVEVRQAAHRAVELAAGPEAQKTARQCGLEAEGRAAGALAAAVTALGRCASVASAAEREAARRLSLLVLDAERRAADAEGGEALLGCVVNPASPKAALDCLTRQVLSARAEVLGRADAGVRGARALTNDAPAAESSAAACVLRQADNARARVASLLAWLQSCAAAVIGPLAGHAQDHTENHP